MPNRFFARPVLNAATLGMTLMTSGCSRAPAPVGGPEAVVAGAPSTDVFLYRLTGLPIVSRGRVFNITNRRGYDNQPSWDGSARILYTSQDGGQTDIFRIDFETSTIERVTSTPESEYSAAPTPDGKAISVVRVERDSTQRLWRFPSDGSAPSVVLPNLKPVGYFAWLDSTTLAVYLLGDPNTLQIADTRDGVARIVASNVGRSLQRVPGGRKASFLHRVGQRWILKTVDPEFRLDGTFHVESIAPMPDSADYVVWRSPTELYTAANSRIFRMRLPNRTWEPVADLAEAGIRRISRLALSPDGSRLALVAEESVDRP